MSKELRRNHVPGTGGLWLEEDEGEEVSSFVFFWIGFSSFLSGFFKFFVPA